MSATKHSKTPWRVSAKYQSDVVDADGFRILAAEGVHLSERYDSDRDGHWSSAPGAHREIEEEEEEANARIAAAAPEMADCLTEILDYRGGAEHALADKYVVERISAALKKAGML